MCTYVNTVSVFSISPVTVTYVNPLYLFELLQLKYADADNICILYDKQEKCWTNIH